MKIKDRIILGAICGYAGSIFARLVNAIEYHTGITDIKYGHMAASLFLDKNLNTSEAEVTAAITNAINTSLLGIGFVYLLALSGRDKAIIKGAGVGAASWVFIYGLTTKLDVSVKSTKKLTPLLGFFDHVISGGIAGWLAAKLGDDSLFPKKGEYLLFEEKN